VLKTLIDQQISKPAGKLYACFVDFRKAFDSVWRNGLFYKLLSSGIGGNFFKIIKSMYSNVRYCVKTPNGLSPYFQSSCGVRQGCNLSPLLFNLYLNDLPNILNSRASDPLILQDTPINSLFWADDLVLLSKSESGLKECLRTLDQFCSIWKLSINEKKTKVMIFTKNGRTNSQHSTYKIQGRTIDITTSYTYLGVDLTPSGSFNRANKQLRLKALRASFKLKSLLSTNFNPSIRLALDLFNSCIKPILLYCGEVLGTNAQGRDLIFHGIEESQNENTRDSIARILSTTLGSEIHILRASRIGKTSDTSTPRPVLVRFQKYSDKLNIIYQSNILNRQNVTLQQPTVSYEIADLEFVLLNYCKITLGVPKSSINAAVRGELGVFPLYIDSQTQLIKYWLRLHSLPNDRLVKKAYNTSVQLQQDWAVHVQDMLCRHGFQTVWLNPAVNANQFGNLFKNRLIDTFLSGWRQEIRSLSKLSTYCRIKKDFCLENYLSTVQNKSFRNIITKLRISAHSLQIEKGRHHNTPASERLCPTCHDNIENESHFIMDCPTYDRERQELLQCIKYKSDIMLPSNKTEMFNMLLSCPADISAYVGQFIYNAFKKRDNIILS